jgi:hypothetical protein
MVNKPHGFKSKDAHKKKTSGFQFLEEHKNDGNERMENYRNKIMKTSLINKMETFQNLSGGVDFKFFMQAHKKNTNELENDQKLSKYKKKERLDAKLEKLTSSNGLFDSESTIDAHK